MTALFWLSLTLIGYTYFGYPIYLWLRVRLQDRAASQKNVSRPHPLPTVSVVIAAHNEEANLQAKIQNLMLTEYPKESLQIVIASDGSTDRSAAILYEHSSKILPVILEHCNGKAYALNEAVKRAIGEIIVFQDARQLVDSNAILELVSCLADQNVGAVSGELLLESTSSASAEGLGIYWRIEKAVRKMESASGSTVGVTGALYAVRRALYVEIPAGTILDDVFVPMRVVKAGKRVVFQSSAIARDRLFVQKGKEFSRKVRTLTGNYQLLRLEPWLFSTKNPLLFRFFCHKLLRLAVPLFLATMLIASVSAKGAFYRAAFLVQVAFYIVAALGAAKPSTKTFKPVAIAHTFVMLNAAAALAFYSFVVGRKRIWV